MKVICLSYLASFSIYVSKLNILIRVAYQPAVNLVKES